MITTSTTSSADPTVHCVCPAGAFGRQIMCFGDRLCHRAPRPNTNADSLNAPRTRQVVRLKTNRP